MPVQVSEELIDDLIRIGTIKNRYQFTERWVFNELGLYVQMKSWKGMTSLKAGGKFISRISLYQPQIGARWEVKKFKPGEWQDLVKPTLELAEWLHSWGRYGGPTAELDFTEAVQGFKKTGALNLPSTEEVEYFKATTALMQAFKEPLNMILERMKLLIGLVQSGQIIVFSGLDIGSTSITHACEVLEECLDKAEKVQVPEHLFDHNATFLAFWRTVADLGWVALDCHRIHEGKPLGTEGTPLAGIVSRESALRAKIDEYIETGREYSRLYKEHMKILEQLGIDEEMTLKARLAVKG